MTAQTPAERKAKEHATKLAKGYVRRGYYATPEEHEKIKDFLKKLQGVCCSC